MPSRSLSATSARTKVAVLTTVSVRPSRPRAMLAKTAPHRIADDQRARQHRGRRRYSEQHGQIGPPVEREAAGDEGQAGHLRVPVVHLIASREPLRQRDAVRDDDEHGLAGGVQVEEQRGHGVCG